MIRILCADLLSAEEWVYRSLYEKASTERKCRADRYRRQEDKLRCVTADALLRTALGEQNYRMEKRAFGKPYIKDHETFCFNLSHSGRYVVLAWGETEVGVDVQRHGDDINMQAIAKRYFTSEEQAYVRMDSRRFYEIWTKKESYVKYTGEGLIRSLKSFSVLAPEAPIRYAYRILEGDYSLSLCTTEEADTFELMDVQQLV